MQEAFRTHIRKALADPSLQTALDANAARRRDARQQAYATLPEPWQVMRRRAHEVRERVISNLDDYLEQFSARVQSNGIILHHASDANEATQIVLEITRRNNAQLVAKSKTMVSEEIDLNHALEAHGIRVVETDLGEYIVQLRGEKPAHIITPAVHLNRDQVGETFHNILGSPLTNDIPTLTTIARQKLRQVFLEADLGISGVNFGVVESGTLCIVTNEGNGRMVTTLPRVHIALMGIERLLPALNDLALMLYLLPRSATGQKLTVYTSLIHGPRKSDEPDGPLERHLILVDNGRSALRQSPLAEALLCIRCGACLNACPVFQEIGGHSYVNVQGESSTYPGPIGSVVSPGMFGQTNFGHLARASSLCGACKDACPVDIDLPKLLLRVRAGLVPAHNEQSPKKEQTSTPNTPHTLAWAMRFYTWAALSPVRFRALQRLMGWLTSVFPKWIKLPNFTGWGYSKEFPRPARSTFREKWATKGISSTASLKSINRGKLEESLISQPNDHIQTHIRPDRSLLERFQDELNALGGNSTHCKKSELPGLIGKLLAKHQVKTIVAWDDTHLPRGLIKSLTSEGVMVQHAPDPAIKVGLTGATAAVAETGSLLLGSGEGRPLLHSLLPEIHLAILDIKNIRATLTDVIAAQELIGRPSAMLVSGPSRTADIEMTLTIGVHGPKELHVFCVDD